MVCRGAIRTGCYRMAQPSHTGSPTCRRLAPDFALFPPAIGFRSFLSSSRNQNARSRPLRTIVLADDTLGGHGATSFPIGHTRLRTTSHPCDTTTGFDQNESDGTDEKAPPRFPARTVYTQPRPGASVSGMIKWILRVSDSAAITPLARTQQRLPMVHHEQPLERLTPVQRFFCE